MTNAEANRIIAEWVWEEGSDEPILVMDNEGYITAPVDTSRRVPPDYCSSLDLTVAATKGKVHIDLEVDEDGYTHANIYDWAHDGDKACGFGHAQASSTSEALAHALAEAILMITQEVSK